MSAAGFCAALSPAAAHAHDFASGALAIGHPWMRETAQGQSAAGGFMTIANSGGTGDRLTGGSTPIAREVQIHATRMDGGVMRMRWLEDGLPVPAGKTVALRPGSVHIMFIGLKRPLKRGEMIPVTLAFARAGKVAVRFKVKAVTFGGPGHDRH